MTKESFISIGWRLIPYWLNNWEQQWGAECSSMIFEVGGGGMEWGGGWVCSLNGLGVGWEWGAAP